MSASRLAFASFPIRIRTAASLVLTKRNLACWGRLHRPAFPGVPGVVKFHWLEITSSRTATAMASSNQADSAEEQPKGVQDEAALLTGFTEIPGISSAWVQADSQDSHLVTVTIPVTINYEPLIKVQYAQRDVSANKLRKYLRTFRLPADITQAKLVSPSFPVELRDVLVHSVSPSGRQQLIVRGGKEGEPTVLEIWKGSRLIRELHVPKDLHGNIYNDNWFSIEPAWDADETRIAYVAESPASASRTPEWGSTSQAPKVEKGSESQSKEAKAGPKLWRGVGEYQEDWGELNTGKKTPKLFVLDISKGEVTGVRGLPPAASMGQPVWTPDSSGLVFVAWPHKSLNFPKLSQRLGIVFCANRPCFLYQIPLRSEEGAKKLETGLMSAMLPKFSPDGKHLYFVSNESAVRSGAHHGSQTLERIEWPSKGERQTVIDVVGRPSGQDTFPGLFAVPFKCLSYAFLGNERLLYTSQWRSTIQILDVKLAADGRAAEISRSTEAAGPQPSSILLAAQHGIAVAVRSGPRHPPSLIIADTEKRPLEWQPVETEEAPFLPGVTSFLELKEPGYEVLQVTPSDSSDALAFEAVLLFGKEGRKRAPTILIPHGGPHSAFPVVYVLSGAFLNALGYNVLQVNYRGSIGFGEDCVQSLPGNIGVNDVADCIAALDAAIAQGYVDEDKVAVIGGSHGGFLTGHLLGQHPERFKAGVLRNPVLDVGLMTQLSDIPDWCFIEGFGSQEGLKRASVKPSLEELEQLTKISPIRHISKIKASMLFVLGAKDRRVVLRDAQQYVSALKATEDPPETRVIVYPNDTHALDLPQTEFEQWINSAWWLKTYL